MFYKYSIWQRFLGFWTLMSIALLAYVFGAMEGQGFRLDAGMKKILSGVFVYGILDAILRTRGTPRYVSVDEDFLEIHGWFGRNQIALSDIQVVEWDKTEKFWFNLFYSRFRIQFISRKTIVLNGAFKEGSKNFVENLQNMGVKLIEKSKMSKMGPI